MVKEVVFSGAGISAESGLKTFRDCEDGLWNNYDIKLIKSDCVSTKLIQE